MDHMTRNMEITDGGGKKRLIPNLGRKLYDPGEGERAAHNIPCLNLFSCGNSHRFLSSDAVDHLSPTLLEDKVLPTYFL